MDIAAVRREERVQLEEHSTQTDLDLLQVAVASGVAKLWAHHTKQSHSWFLSELEFNGLSGGRG